jgi:alpha-tubulin suppressor-like RCC1 family protein
VTAYPAQQHRWTVSASLVVCLLAGILCCPRAQAAGGTVEGWGLNGFGQLGNGAASATGCDCVPLPGPVHGLSNVTQVAAGRAQTLALLADGTVMAWGDNRRGQLGGNGVGNSPVPVPVSGLSGVVAVAAGDETGMALLASGTVMAWGDNSNGELGEGSTNGPEFCTAIGTPSPCAKMPVLVPGLSDIVAIASGGAYNMALRADGTVLAWGFDEAGTIGDGEGKKSGCSCIPQPTPVPGVSGAVAISAGENTAEALLADGTVRAWGANRAGALGTGGTEVSAGGCECLGPVPVKGLSRVRSVAAGGEFGLALLAGGAAESWGFNEDGELGLGQATPLAVNPCKCVPSPTAVGGLSGPLAVSAGESHALALLANGSVESWGRDQDGQLGHGAVDLQPHPDPALVISSGASAAVAGLEDSFALIGPSQSLKLSLAGAGSGVVGGQGLLCPPACEGRYPQGQVESLRAQGTGGSGFAGFSGPCAGTGICRARMDGDQALTATFGPPKGTQISSATINSRRRFATFAFTAPGAITGFECELIRPRPRPRIRRRHAHVRRPRPSFSACGALATYKHLTPGRYTFEVRALDILGADANPAAVRFRVKASHRRVGARR